MLQIPCIILKIILSIIIRDASILPRNNWKAKAKSKMLAYRRKFEQNMLN